MKNAPTLQSELAADRIARRISIRLKEGEAWLPYEICERLRASREQAVSQRRRSAAVLQRHVQTSSSAQGGTLTLGGPGDEGGTWWRTLISAIPVLALVAGLAMVNSNADQVGMTEVTEVDTALLTDDLPPAAYADPGFIQFLKTSAPAAER